MTTVAMEIEAKHVLPQAHEHAYISIHDPLEMTTDALKQLVAVDSSAVSSPQEEDQEASAKPASENKQPEAEDDMASSTAASSPVATDENPDNNNSSIQEIKVDEESDTQQQQQQEDESDWHTSSCSESPSRFSFIDFPAKVRASLFPARKPRKLKRKKTRASVVDASSPSPSKPTLTSMPTPLNKYTSLTQQQLDEPDKNVEKFKHFWDEKLRNTMDKITSLHKTEAASINNGGVSGGSGAAAFEQQNDVFHLLLKLYAHQDIVEELYSSCESNATEVSACVFACLYAHLFVYMFACLLTFSFLPNLCPLLTSSSSTSRNCARSSFTGTTPSSTSSSASSCRAAASRCRSRTGSRGSCGRSARTPRATSPST